MRASRPSQRRPAFLLLLAGFAVGVVLAAATAASAEDPATSRGKAARLSAENAALAKREQAALLDLYALGSRLRRAERQVAILRARAASLQQQEQSARDQLAIARHAEQTAQEQLGERIRALYIEGEPDAVSIVFGARSLSDAIDAIDNLSRLAAEDDRIIEQVRKTRASLHAAIRTLAGRERELRAITAAAETARAALARARDDRASYVASLALRQQLNGQQIRTLNDLASGAEQKAAQIEAAQPSRAQPSGATESSAALASPAQNQPASTSDGSPAPGRQVRVSMTMYCLPGYTATGIPAGPGVVATDPSAIPLGTRMSIPGYGDGVAADTGSAVSGLTIDAWVASCKRADDWGRRTVTITIYN